MFNTKQALSLCAYVMSLDVNLPVLSYICSRFMFSLDKIVATG
ncbi:hypothetical protein [Anaerobiospirillum sp. NML120448]|nr:hypothetical protein [Anaerobiospirillum sp. NML120448]